MSTGRFSRLAETDRQTVNFFVDDVATAALEGDTLLVAILVSGKQVRRSEFGDGNRAGFCLMGSCQDCWVSTDSGARVKACLTRVEPGMRVRTKDVKLKWTNKE